MFDSLRTWLSPAARRRRKLHRRHAWAEAQEEAAAERDRRHPRPDTFFSRAKHEPPKS